MGKIIGIDLGTTNSCVSVMEGGKPVVITNSEGSRTTPSVVAFTKDGERLVGQVAKRQSVTNPEKTVFSIKRFMGRKHSEVKSEEKIVPYTVSNDSNDNVTVGIDDKTYTPPEISAMVLQKLKSDAEAYLGSQIEEAIITVPAYFNDSQRQATKDAGEIAGLKVSRIINEPTAAALAYGLDKAEGNIEKIAVFDFGGGTFDISILEVGEGAFEVLSTNGDTHLGGDDLDQIIIDWLIEEFKKDQGIDLGQDKMALQRLKEAAEKAKVELSSATTTEVNLPFITAGAEGPKHLNLTLTRAKLEQMISGVMDRLLKPCEIAIKDAELDKNEINEVILVGGSTRIPAVKKLVKDFFGKEPNSSVNPDEAVSLGAAIQGGILMGDVKDVVLLDVTPLSLGIETLGSVFTKLIEKNTTIPTSKSQVFSTAADGQTSVDIHVLQGERPMANDNRTLGRFQLTDIPPAPRGVPQIEVSFDIDKDGIVHVSAKDKGTGKEQKITIQASSGLTEEEIERMKKEAEANADTDRQKKEQIDAKNELDSLIYSAEKALSDAGEKAPTDLKTKIEEEMKNAKKVLEEKPNDVAALNQAKESLQKLVYEMGSAMYKSEQDGGQTDQAEGQQPGTGDNSAAGENNEDNVVDADYEVEDDNK